MDAGSSVTALFITNVTKKNKKLHTAVNIVIIIFLIYRF